MLETFVDVTEKQTQEDAIPIPEDQNLSSASPKNNTSQHHLTYDFELFWADQPEKTVY